MGDPYRNSNDPSRIQTKQDRQKQAVGKVWEGVKAVVGFLATAAGQAIDRLIPQGASELAGALIPSSAVVQNLDPQQEPAIGAPQQEVADQTQSTGIEPPQRHRSQADVASQREGLQGYMTGYKPPERVNHNTLYGINQSQSQSQSL